MCKRMFMNLNRYELVADSRHEQFEFYSDGDAGCIRKVVLFEKISPYLYNLSFGDWSDVKNALNDQCVSNNGDRDKVLVTVAHAVMNFMQHHPYAVLFARGSTAARTGLYQMGINKNWDRICSFYDVHGFLNDKWEPFERDKNYEAFTLSQRDNSVFLN